MEMEAVARISWGGLRVGLLTTLLAVLIGWAAPALASDFNPAGAQQQVAASPLDAAQRRAEFERWRGRSCPIGGCEPAPRSQATTTLAFGAAVCAIAWISRRRNSGAA
jgi:hypothetical protein